LLLELYPNSTLHTPHFTLGLRSSPLGVWEQLGQYFSVCRGSYIALTQVALSFSRFFAQYMAAIGMMALEFTAARNLDTFGRAAVRLHFRHNYPSFL